jgi:hypothetical protein
MSMPKTMRIWVFFTVFVSVGLSPLGADLGETSNITLDPLTIASAQPPPDKMTGYREMKKLLTGKTSGFLQKFLGESYWTKTIAPIVLDSLYSTVAASATGHLRMKDSSTVLENTANRFAITGKKELSALSQEKLPELPVVGNLVHDLAESQSLSLRQGNIHYRMRMKKRLAPEFKVGQFAFSGGTEAYLDGLDFSRKSVASIGYEGLGSSYRVQLYGKDVRFDVSFSPVDLRLDWNPDVIKFNLNLNVGSWL